MQVQVPHDVVCFSLSSVPSRASRAKLQRLEKETQEMEKTMEALRHTQAKCSELAKANRKLMEQTHGDQREIIRLKEELQGSKAKVREEGGGEGEDKLYVVFLCVVSAYGQTPSGDEESGAAIGGRGCCQKKDYCEYSIIW